MIRRLALLLLAVSARAETLYDADLLGFSADGKAAAYEVFAQGDNAGGGPCYARLHLIDVEKNAFVGKELEGQGDTDEEPCDRVRARLRKAAEPRLAALKIEAGRGAQAGPAELEVRLSTFTLAGNCGPDGIRRVGFSLSAARAGGKAAVLQRDRRLPESRRCPSAYSVYKVFASGSSVLALVASNPRGYEGDDREILSVAGRVP